ncbi:hypothetical protein ACLOJK_019583 [Asimina triloba]
MSLIPQLSEKDQILLQDEFSKVYQIADFLWSKAFGRINKRACKNIKSGQYQPISPSSLQVRHQKSASAEIGSACSEEEDSNSNSDDGMLGTHGKIPKSIFGKSIAEDSGDNDPAQQDEFRSTTDLATTAGMRLEDITQQQNPNNEESHEEESTDKDNDDDDGNGSSKNSLT